MKKLLIFALCVLLVLSFASCGETVTSSWEESESSQSSSDSQESGLQEVDLKGSDTQEELRQKFEDCIKITQTTWEAKKENLANFPFEVTFYKPDDEPEESDDHVHYYQLMFRLKEKFKEYTTYKIRIFNDYPREDLCSSGECDPEYIFSTTAVRDGRPFRISFELHGEGLEPIISGDELWTFLYFYMDNANELFLPSQSQYWDDSKPIKLSFSDIDGFDF